MQEKRIKGNNREAKKKRGRRKEKKRKALAAAERSAGRQLRSRSPTGGWKWERERGEDEMVDRGMWRDCGGDSQTQAMTPVTANYIQY